MKKVISDRAKRRLSVAEAKARLSEALRAAGHEPTVIHNRGRDVAVLIGFAEYERLVANVAEREPVRAFLDDVAALKQRLGGGADFAPERAVIVPRDAFGRAGT